MLYSGLVDRSPPDYSAAAVLADAWAFSWPSLVLATVCVPLALRARTGHQGASWLHLPVFLQCLLLSLRAIEILDGAGQSILLSWRDFFVGTLGLVFVLVPVVVCCFSERFRTQSRSPILILIVVLAVMIDFAAMFHFYTDFSYRYLENETQYSAPLDPEFDRS